MHECTHGYACYCSGDINDHDTGDEYTDACECDCEEDDDFDDLDDDFDGEPLDEMVLDCGDPNCCMPGEHLRSECHTASDIEAMYAEHESSEMGKEVKP